MAVKWHGIELPLVPFLASGQCVSQLARPSTPSIHMDILPLPSRGCRTLLPSGRRQLQVHGDQSMHVVVITAPDCK